MNRAICALAPSYFPDLEYFWQLAQCQTVLITDHYQFVRRSRATISAPLQTSQPALTIPVRHTRQPVALFQKEIDNSSNWARKHLQTIRHIFHHAPYQYIYQPQLEKLLADTNVYLTDLLVSLLEELLSWLHMEITIVRASKLDPALKNEALLLKAAAQRDAHCFLTTESVWQRGAVQAAVLEQGGLKSSTFKPLADFHILKSNSDLSILYFLMHYGPEAGYMLRQYLPAVQAEE